MLMFGSGGPNVGSALAARTSGRRWRTERRVGDGGPNVGSALLTRTSGRRWRAERKFRPRLFYADVRVGRPEQPTRPAAPNKGLGRGCSRLMVGADVRLANAALMFGSPNPNKDLGRGCSRLMTASSVRLASAARMFGRLVRAGRADHQRRTKV